MTRHDSPADARPLPIRPLLDTLGLGSEQTMSMLGRERPDWAAFTVWIEATAGRPDYPMRWPDQQPWL